MSSPGIVPVESIYAGDDWGRTFTISQAGTPVNLVTTGWSAWSAMWRPGAGNAAQITIAVDVINAATGVLVLSMTGPQTEQMATDGVWDLQGTLGGKTVTILRGTTTWTQDVTR